MDAVIAGLAMQGLLSASGSTTFEYEFQHENLAMDAVASADALLAELVNS